MSYFAVLKGILSDTVMDMIQRNFLQLNEIVRQKFMHDEDLNITHEVRFALMRKPITMFNFHLDFADSDIYIFLITKLFRD